MSAFPLMIDGTRLRALVVGGGPVAERKVKALLMAGAQVRLVAPDVTPGLAALELVAPAADEGPSLAIERREYSSDDIADAMVVVAATASREVNARVASDADAASRLVNVVDGSARGNCATAATHRSGDLLIAVSTGRAPGVAARIREALASRFDARYDGAIQAITALRTRLLAEGRTDDWRRASNDLLGDDFCAEVESGTLVERVSEWR